MVAGSSPDNHAERFAAATEGDGGPGGSAVVQTGGVEEVVYRRGRLPDLAQRETVAGRRADPADRIADRLEPIRQLGPGASPLPRRFRLRWVGGVAAGPGRALRARLVGGPRSARSVKRRCQALDVVVRVYGGSRSGRRVALPTYPPEAMVPACDREAVLVDLLEDRVRAC